MRAVVADDFVIIRGDLTRVERAFVVWHEIGHVMLHPGGAEWWQSRPQGQITVAKFERQANDFAWLYPIWKGDSFEEVLHYTGVDIDPRSRSLRGR